MMIKVLIEADRIMGEIGETVAMNCKLLFLYWLGLLKYRF